MVRKNQNAVASIIGAVLFLLLYNFVDIFDLFDTKITYNANKSTSSYSSSSNSTQRETALQKATLDAKKEMFTISKTTVRRDGYFQYIEGTLKNNTGRRGRRSKNFNTSIQRRKDSASTGKKSYTNGKGYI